MALVLTDIAKSILLIFMSSKTLSLRTRSERAIMVISICYIFEAKSMAKQSEPY